MECNQLLAPPNYFHRLADELLVSVFSHLCDDPKTLANSALATKRFASLLRDNHLWKELCKKRNYYFSDVSPFYLLKLISSSSPEMESTGVLPVPIEIARNTGGTSEVLRNLIRKRKNLSIGYEIRDGDVSGGSSSNNSNRSIVFGDEVMHGSVIYAPRQRKSSVTNSNNANLGSGSSGSSSLIVSGRRQRQTNGVGKSKYTSTGVYNNHHNTEFWSFKREVEGGVGVLREGRGELLMMKNISFKNVFRDNYLT
ncbi:hypothetical protein HK098_002011, partial [Nowakowskiella sp. JEL0407]